MFCDPDSRSFGLAANFNGSETRLSTAGLAGLVTADGYQSADVATPF
jgi:hypothetical protein